MSPSVPPGPDSGPGGLVVPPGLRPHPEGGSYRETWRSSVVLDTPRGPRASATAITFLLEAGERSGWHRVRGAAELWVWAGGGELELRLGGTGERPAPARTVRLGPGGQHLVGPDEWQSAAPVAGAVISACIVSPGFDFADLELAPAAAHRPDPPPLPAARRDRRTGPLRVLLVCEGNVHRSPMAAALLRARLDGAGVGTEIEVASAGVRTEPGMRMQAAAVDALAGRGVAAGDGHRSAPLTAAASDTDVLLAATLALRDGAVRQVPGLRDRAFAWRELVALAAAEPVTLPAGSARARWEQLLAQARERRGLVRPTAPDGFDVPDPVGRRDAVFAPLAADLDTAMTAVAALLVEALRT